MNTNFHQFTMNKINGQAMKLDQYKGKVLLVVNVASECGLTPQYEALEKIVVKGDGQHPLYQFLINEKPEAKLVNGNSFEEKLKTYGITRTTQKDILWNFEKFLINKNGEVVQRFAPDVAPEDPVITSAIEELLKS